MIHYNLFLFTANKKGNITDFVNLSKYLLLILLQTSSRLAGNSRDPWNFVIIWITQIKRYI